VTPQAERQPAPSEEVGPDAALVYHNTEFLDSDAARPVRVLAEYLGPMEVFRRQRIHDTIVFFGSARLAENGPFGRYYADARELARLITAWSMGLSSPTQRFVICSGGGGGIMEAANRGARDAGGRTIGLNIGLPHEQRPNPYISDGLCFQFHYFFMRKLWFAYMARAMVVFPGGFGTLDEFFEMLTLSQTKKLDREIPIILYGSEYWKDLVDFEALVRHGMIDPGDLSLFEYADSPAHALAYLQSRLESKPETTAPAFAKSKTPSGRARS